MKKSVLLFMVIFSFIFFGFIVSAQSTGDIGIFIVSSTTAPNVSLVSPANASTFISSSVTFVCDASDDIRVANVSLYINNAHNVTKAGDNLSSFTFAEIVSLVNGDYTWRCEARDNFNNLGNSTTRTLTVSVSGGGGGSSSVVASASGGGSGGGGGGGGVAKKYDFTLDTAILKARSTLGATFTKSLTISNPTAVPLLMNISTSVNYLLISDKLFIIKPNESKVLLITFITSGIAKPDIYTAEVLLKSQYGEKRVPVVFEIGSKQALFDASIDILAKYKTLKAGEELVFQITLFNLGETGKVDVNLEYGVKDFNNKFIFDDNSSVSVETQASFSKSIKLPNSLHTGDYAVFVKAIYGDSVGTASDVFSVVSKFSLLFQLLILGGAVFVIGGGIVVFYEIKHMQLKSILKSQRSELVSIKTKLLSKKLDVAGKIVELKKLQTQKELLENAYRNGYIRKEAYLISKRKIELLANAAREKHL